MGTYVPYMYTCPENVITKKNKKIIASSTTGVNADMG